MLEINLKGKKAFVAGIGDDRGFGWAIAKALHQAGATVFAGVWPPMFTIFSSAFSSGKFDSSREYPGGRLSFEKVYPFDASFDQADDVPEEIRENKRYKGLEGFTVGDVTAAFEKEYQSLDIFVHSLANAPEIKHPLLQTSRKGYVSAISASSYSFVSMVSHFGPMMSGGACMNLTYLASERVIPGYGGGMSSAKAALESDTRTLAYEAGRQFNLRVNAISAGAYGSRAAKAIGFIEKMIDYSHENAPLQRAVEPQEVAYMAAFLLSDLAGAVTGEVIHVDCGLHAMGVALDSRSLSS